MQRVFVFVLLILFAGMSFAAKSPMEMSMLLEGEIQVSSQGQVARHEIKDADKVPSAVLNFVNASVESWEFEPPVVDGQSVALLNTMRILVVAQEKDDGSYELRIQSAAFSPADGSDTGYEVATEDMAAPRYPRDAARVGAGARVFLVLKIGRNGQVEDVFAEQINIITSGMRISSDRDLHAAFERASVETARRWKFIPPSRGEQADADYWTLRVPITYFMGSAPRAAYGRWEPYLRTPRKAADWAGARLLASSPEAMLDGKPRIAGGVSGLRLKTPIVGLLGDG